METLSVELRKLLERTIVKARDIAEAASRTALEALAVHYHEPFRHMDSEERTLRRHLRAHARRLGDRKDPRSGDHAIERLVHECAYEKWHGMLFARFLAENHLLIESDFGVPITLNECEELAKKERIDKWQLAARFAHCMLPQVFRPDHPVLEVQVPIEYRLKLEELLEGLPAAIFVASDALGWVYQFWQSKKKQEVNNSETKIGADELPAVTQLFTEPYMVRFLLDNTLGAWWVSRNPGTPCPVSLKYLRVTEEGASTAGDLDAWPDDLSELRLLDPCCGSGHFLVEALLMLVPMRMAREGVTASDAIDAVLSENLYGLEIDQRCVALAAFALALAAWTYPDAGGFRTLPQLNLACSGLAPNMSKKQWLALAELANEAGEAPEECVQGGAHSTPLAVRLSNSLSAIYDLFAQGPELGSLINPRSVEADLFQGGFESVAALLKPVMDRERFTFEQKEGVIAARGMARAAELLTCRYTLVITNVPYLARRKQGEGLRQYCERQHPAAKQDLATVFLERCLRFCAVGGTVGLVLPQNWLSLKTYSRLRESLLKKQSWHLVARLGEGGFRSSAAAGAFAVLLVLSRSHPTRRPGDQIDHAAASNVMYLLDVSGFRKASEKAVQLAQAEIKGIKQVRQLENPDARVTLSEDYGPLLEEHVGAFQGIASGDYACFGRKFWEMPEIFPDWRFQQSTVRETVDFGGREHVLHWGQDENLFLQNRKGARIQGKSIWGNPGVLVSQMRVLPATRYTGELFDNNGCAIGPAGDDVLPALWCFCASPAYNEAVRCIDQKLNVTNATLAQIPFDLEHWTKIARDRYPNGLPLPYSNDPTQWIYHGHPCGAVVWNESEKRTTHGSLRADAAVLQVSVARLLGYRWPAEEDVGMKLAEEQRKWVLRSQALQGLADTDGIVCIPSVRGESTAEDRLLGLLADAFGITWSEGVLAKLPASAGSANLDDWLRNHFFDQHCQLFHNRPFVWHVWDGRKRDGFHALINYHRLAEGNGQGRRLLESLTYSYLGDWISRQRDGVKRGKGGAEDRLAAALELQKRLEAILEGEPPFDIFIRWKPMSEQPIGWDPDINDGVRINIRPFMAQDVPNGKKGAGILRSRPKNIRWGKDLGREAVRDEAQFPWFRNNGQFTAERVNDMHLANATKQAARAQAGGKQ